MDRTERLRLRAGLRAIELVLLAVAVVALGWFAAVHLATRLDQASQDRVLESLREPRNPASPGPSVVPPRALVARLEVPRLGMKAIVREGVDSGTLRRAVGHIPDTALPGQPGNAALAGHRDTFFRPLRHVRKDDRIRVTTPERIHEYRVTDTRVVGPEDVSVLAPTDEPTLTLVTCYPFGFVGAAPKRFVVRATQIGGHADAAASTSAPVLQPAGLAAPAPSRATVSDAGQKQAAKKIARKPVRPPAAKKASAKKNGPSKRLGPWRRFLKLFDAR